MSEGNNIKVAVRVRPFNQREKDLKCSCVVSMSGQSTVVQEQGKPKTFTYDFSYWSHNESDSNYASQDTVMRDIGNVILDNALKGYNGCLFAYGQTGSGKSYSVMGYGDQPGIVPRSVDAVFIEKDKLPGDQELRVWISFIEIYNEQIRDLLHPGSEVVEMKVMDHPQLGVYIPGLTESPCRAASDVQKLMDFGTKKRVTACTNMNATSSRSHAVFTIKVQRLTGTPPVGDKKDERKALNAKINLVDLAGSERVAKTGAEGATLKEGCAINQSLSALGMVIKELAEKMAKVAAAKSKAGAKGKAADEAGGAVPFRASKLTHLLKDSLSGNSKTYMMAAISPADDNVEESISTLRFASSVKKIKTVAKQNIDKKDEMINNLQAELKKLKAMADGGAPLGDDDPVHEEIEHREKMLEDMQKSYETQLEEAQHYESARDDALKDMGLDSSEIDDIFGVDKDTPYLLNVNSDPSLAGCLMYFLKKGIATTIGSSAENAIVLQGLGIPDHLCQIENNDHRSVTISMPSMKDEASGPKPRVCVNGSLLTPEKARRLNHNDKVFFGRAYVMKIVIPILAKNLGKGGLVAEDLHEEDLIKHLLPEESEAWGELQLYLEDLWQRLGEERGRELFEHLSKASHLVDEANDITAEMRPEERLKFEVELVWDIHRDAKDIIVIRVLQFPQDSVDASVLYYWTMNEFAERLDVMRDCYDTFHRSGTWEGKGNSLEDPWMEASSADLKHMLQRHVDTQLIKREVASSGGTVITSSTTTVTTVVTSTSGNASASKASAMIRSKASSVAMDSKVAAGRGPMGSAMVNGKTPSGRVSGEQEGMAQGGTSMAVDNVINAMREQLKDKIDKEELYKHRISVLQQQISMYEQHVLRQSSQQAAAKEEPEEPKRVPSSRILSREEPTKVRVLSRTPQSAPSLAPPMPLAPPEAWTTMATAPFPQEEGGYVVQRFVQFSPPVSTGYAMPQSPKAYTAAATRMASPPRSYVYPQYPQQLPAREYTQQLPAREVLLSPTLRPTLSPAPFQRVLVEQGRV